MVSICCFSPRGPFVFQEFLDKLWIKLLLKEGNLRTPHRHEKRSRRRPRASAGGAQLQSRSGGSAFGGSGGGHKEFPAKCAIKRV